MRERPAPPETREGPPETFPRVPILVFALDGREYGVPIPTVVEVVRMVAVTPVPEAPPWVEGMINYRGRVIAVIDLRTRLGIGRKEPGLSTAILVVSVGGAEVGLVVDEVVEVLSVAADALEQGARDAAASPVLSAVLRVGARLVALLDPARLHDAPMDLPPSGLHDAPMDLRPSPGPGPLPPRREKGAPA